MKSAGNLWIGFGIVAWSTTLSCYKPGTAATDATPTVVDAPVIDAPIDALQMPNLVFVSKQVTSGNMGGLAGADATCNAEAAEARLLDTFRAVLWTAAEPVAMRFASSRGWVDLAGLPVADRPSDFGPTMLYPPSKLASGTPAPLFDLVATGFSLTATTHADCNGWTSSDNTLPMMVIRVNAIIDGNTGTSCGAPTRMLCASIGRQRVISPPQATGRLAFIAPRILLTGGINQADAHCQSTAAAAGLSARFRAMLAIGANSAAERFLQTDKPWRRVDGPILAQSNADFFALNWQIPLLRDAAGAVPSDFFDTSGAYLAVVGASNDNCQNWTSSAIVGVTAISPISNGNVGSGFVCGVAAPLVCLEN